MDFHKFDVYLKIVKIKNIKSLVEIIFIFMIIKSKLVNYIITTSLFMFHCFKKSYKNKLKKKQLKTKIINKNKWRIRT